MWYTGGILYRVHNGRTERFSKIFGTWLPVHYFEVNLKQAA